MQVPRAAMEWAQESFGRGELEAERRLRRRVTVGAQLASHAGESPARAWRGDTAASVVRQCTGDAERDRRRGLSGGGVGGADAG